MDATYARIVGIVGRGLRAAGHQAPELAITAVIPGEDDPIASVLGQLAVDGHDADAAATARAQFVQLADGFRLKIDHALIRQDWNALAEASRNLKLTGECLADLDAYIACPEMLDAITFEIVGD